MTFIGTALSIAARNPPALTGVVGVAGDLVQWVSSWMRRRSEAGPTDHGAGRQSRTRR